MIAPWQIIWAAEGILETSGAFFAYRRRLNILFALLAYAAISDIITAFIMWQFGGYAYAIAEWIYAAGKMLILCALACQIVSRMLEDYRRLTGLACGLCALLGVVVGFVWNRGETWAGKFLDAEISASMFLGAMIVLGWIGKKKELEGTWNLIALGLLTFTLGSAGCAMLSERWPISEQLYPIPALVGLLLWNLAAWPKKKVKLPEFRGQPVQERKPMQSAPSYDDEFLRKMKIQA